MSEPMKQVMFRCPPELYAEVQARAAADDRTVAQTIRRALIEYLKRNG